MPMLGQLLACCTHDVLLPFVHLIPFDTVFPPFFACPMWKMNHSPLFGSRRASAL